MAVPARQVEILKAAMQSLGFESKNLVIYAMLADLDTPENANGINFDHFLDSITAKLGYLAQSPFEDSVLRNTRDMTEPSKTDHSQPPESPKKTIPA